MDFENLEQFKNWFMENCIDKINFSNLLSSLKNGGVSFLNFILRNAPSLHNEGLIKNMFLIYFDNRCFEAIMFHFKNRYAAIIHMDLKGNLLLNFYDLPFPYDEFREIVISHFMVENKYIDEYNKKGNDYYLGLYERYQKEIKEQK